MLQDGFARSSPEVRFLIKNQSRRRPTGRRFFFGTHPAGVLVRIVPALGEGCQEANSAVYSF